MDDVKIVKENSRPDSFIFSNENDKALTNKATSGKVEPSNQETLYISELLSPLVASDVLSLERSNIFPVETSDFTSLDVGEEQKNSAHEKIISESVLASMSSDEVAMKELDGSEVSVPTSSDADAIAEKDFNAADGSSLTCDQLLPSKMPDLTTSDAAAEKTLNAPDCPSLKDDQILPSDVLDLTPLDAASGKDINTTEGVSLTHDLLTLTVISDLTSEVVGGKEDGPVPSSIISSDNVTEKEPRSRNVSTFEHDQLLHVDVSDSTSLNDVLIKQSCSGNQGTKINDSTTKMLQDTSKHSGFAQIAPIRVKSESVAEDSINRSNVLMGELGPSKFGNFVPGVESLESITPTLDDLSRVFIDTASPFESVKEAVSMFGGIVDWKAHRLQTVERRKLIERELEKSQEEIPTLRKQCEAAENAKTQVLTELDSIKRDIEEVKLSLERAHTEEHQAKQDSELAKLRVEEMEQGIADESSVAAKVQLEVAKSRHVSAISELKTVKYDLESLRTEYSSLVTEKDLAVKKAEEAIYQAKEVEKTVEEFMIELISTKESLESAHASHLEAEEHRIGAAMARDQDSLIWDKELKKAEEEIENINCQISLEADLKSKIDASSILLLDLKTEMEAYMGSDHDLERKSGNDIQEAVTFAKNELGEVNLKIEKSTNQVNLLKASASSLKSEVENEKLALSTIMQREGMASVAVASLEAEVNMTKAELSQVKMREKEAKENVIELPKKLQVAANEADEAKLVSQTVHEELRKAKEEADHAKATLNIVESRLLATKKETEAARASEKLAEAAIKALRESCLDSGTDSEKGVTISVEEYYELSKRAHDAEDLANTRVADAIFEVENARESESRAISRLEVANRDLAEKKVLLDDAIDKADKAKAGKLGVEHELRKWRAEHEQRRKSIESGQLIKAYSSPELKLEGTSVDMHKPVSAEGNNVGGNSSSGVNTVELQVVKKKKRSFFPRILMFLARRKVQNQKLA